MRLIPAPPPKKPMLPPSVPHRRLLMNHQLHFLVTDADYEFISTIAVENEQTIAETVRRMIRTARRMRSAPQPIRRAPAQ